MLIPPGSRRRATYSGASQDSHSRGCYRCSDGSGACWNPWTRSEARGSTANPPWSLETLNWGCFH